MKQNTRIDRMTKELNIRKEEINTFMKNRSTEEVVDRLEACYYNNEEGLVLLCRDAVVKMVMYRSLTYRVLNGYEKSSIANELTKGKTYGALVTNRNIVYWATKEYDNDHKKQQFINDMVKR